MIYLQFKALKLRLGVALLNLAVKRQQWHCLPRASLQPQRRAKHILDNSLIGA
jgi:hypothetical protein